MMQTVSFTRMKEANHLGNDKREFSWPIGEGSVEVSRKKSCVETAELYRCPCPKQEWGREDSARQMGQPLSLDLWSMMTETHKVSYGCEVVGNQIMKSLDPCWPFSGRLRNTGWAPPPFAQMPLVFFHVPLATRQSGLCFLSSLPFQTLSFGPLACLVLQSTLARWFAAFISITNLK